ASVITSVDPVHTEALASGAPVASSTMRPVTFANPPSTAGRATATPTAAAVTTFAPAARPLAGRASVGPGIVAVDAGGGSVVPDRGRTGAHASHPSDTTISATATKTMARSPRPPESDVRIDWLPRTACGR